MHIYKQLKDKAASMERRRLAKPECYAVRICWEMRKRLSLPQQICWPILNWRRNCLTRHIITVQSLFGCRQDGWSYGRFEGLGKDTRNVYGAEAKYKVAQIYFDGGQTDKAEQEVLNYIEVSTPHTYWLARSFVLLADVYMKLGRNLDAKQYLLSLKQNYQADDDIAGMIESRLEKLKQRIKIKNKC